MTKIHTGKALLPAVPGLFLASTLFFMLMPLTALAASTCIPRDRSGDTRSIPPYRNASDGSVNTREIINIVKTIL